MLIRDKSWRLYDITPAVMRIILKPLGANCR